MIRIDEIYNHTFWPYVKSNIPKTRLFYCDPPGTAAPETLSNFGSCVSDINYIYCHDQEPIHLDLHSKLFNNVDLRNLDLNYNTGTVRSAIVTSESNSQPVDTLCNTHGWKSFYYFFHGWAALDWYRGYNQTFLIRHWTNRKIIKTFIAPNRIVAGQREHRLEMLYHIFKNNMSHNHVSCPAVCPAENISILDAVDSLVYRCPDIKEVFSAQALPINFAGEVGHPMHSCWLSLFDQSAESMLYLVTETVAHQQRHHLTEKTFKPIALGMPFIIVGTRGSLEYLRSYGFRTFGGIWDESYDQADDADRIECIASLLRSLDELPIKSKQELFDAAVEVIEHNWNHFYNGGFETVLWHELTGMLTDLQRHFND